MNNGKQEIYLARLKLKNPITMPYEGHKYQSPVPQLTLYKAGDVVVGETGLGFTSDAVDYFKVKVPYSEFHNKDEAIVTLYDADLVEWITEPYDYKTAKLRSICPNGKTLQNDLIEACRIDKSVFLCLNNRKFVDLKSHKNCKKFMVIWVDPGATIDMSGAENCGFAIVAYKGKNCRPGLLYWPEGAGAPDENVLNVLNHLRTLPIDNLIPGFHLDMRNARIDGVSRDRGDYCGLVTLIGQK